MARHLTVVYTIHDEKFFEEEQKMLMSKFQNSNGKPWAITAMSHGDEIHRLSLIEDAHSANRHDLIDDICGLIDPGNIDSIEDLENQECSNGVLHA